MVKCNLPLYSVAPSGIGCYKMTVNLLIALLINNFLVSNLSSKMIVLNVRISKKKNTNICFVFD